MQLGIRISIDFWILNGWDGSKIYTLMEEIYILAIKRSCQI